MLSNTHYYYICYIMLSNTHYYYYYHLILFIIIDISIALISSCRAEALPAAESALKCFFPNTSYYVADIAIRDKVGGP